MICICHIAILCHPLPLPPLVTTTNSFYNNSPTFQHKFHLSTLTTTIYWPKTWCDMHLPHCYFVPPAATTTLRYYHKQILYAIPQPSTINSTSLHLDHHTLLARDMVWYGFTIWIFFLKSLLHQTIPIFICLFFESYMRAEVQLLRSYV